MGVKFEPTTEERPGIIITGIIILYLLISGFIAYLYFLHKIPFIPAMTVILIFSVLYIQRFIIIYKLLKHDNVKIIDNFLMINGVGVDFYDIKSFGTREYKPQVIFFFNNKMVVYNEADFCIKTPHEQFEFKIIGSEKIQLMKEFLKQIKK